MMKIKTFEIIQLVCLSLFGIFISIFGFKELVSVQNITLVEEIKNVIRFVSGLLLGISINFLSSLPRKKETIQDNYVEKKSTKSLIRIFKKKSKAPMKELEPLSVNF